MFTAHAVHITVELKLQTPIKHVAIGFLTSVALGCPYTRFSIEDIDSLSEEFVSYPVPNLASLRELPK